MNIEEYIASGILESYALGETSEQENALVNCLVKTNPIVANELRLIQNSLEHIAKLEPKEVAVELKNQIWEAITAESESQENSFLAEKKIIAQNPINSTENNKELKINAFSWQRFAASSILIISSLSFSAYLYFQNKDVNQQISVLNKTSKELQSKNNSAIKQLAFISNANTKKVFLEGLADKPQAKAVVFWNTKNKEVLLSELDLPTSPKDKQYQLWALVDGKPVDAGIIDKKYEEKMLTMKNIEDSQAFAITLEPKGGSTNPHLEELCVIGNLK